MSEYHDLFDRAALDPDPAFEAELEGRLSGAAALAAPPERPADRRRRWAAVVVLAAAAAVAAVAIFLTSSNDSDVTTVPGTEPPSTTAAGPPSSVTLPETTVAPPTTAAPPATSVPPVPAGGGLLPPVPTGFSPASVTFVLPTKGWLLGGACGQPTCPTVSLVTTDDRGKTWYAVGAPPVGFGDPDQGGDRSVRFATEHDGYVFGGELWSTHDGATSWQQVTLPGADDSSNVAALETSAGTTYAVFTTSDGFRIASSPAVNDDWRLDPLVIPYGGGPVPSIQLVLHGTAGWLLENDRVVIAGARLAGDGLWHDQTTFTDAGGPALLAASSEMDVAAVISEGIWGGPSTPVTRFARSTDAGQQFRVGGPGVADVPIPPGSAAALASPRPTAAVVAGADSSGVPILVATFDDGQTWSTVFTGSGAGSWTDLGFTTLDQGVVVLGHDDGTADLLMTSDGGHSWAAVPVTG
jgi:hypothetical protein